MPVTENKLTLKFYDSVVDSFLKYAVIIAIYKNQFVFCKHIKRLTLELPGGKRKNGESIEQTAKRELYEETGASKYTLQMIGPYSVTELGVESFGMLYFAKIDNFDTLPTFEMEKIVLIEDLSSIKQWTYPTLHPIMLAKYLEVKEEASK